MGSFADIPAKEKEFSDVVETALNLLEYIQQILQYRAVINLNTKPSPRQIN